MARRLNRRELARLAGFSALALPLGDTAAAAPAAGRGRVGLAELRAPAEGGALDAAAARAAVTAAVCAATGAASARAALSPIFKPSDTIGIKLNCLGGRNLSPRRELVEALVGLLVEAGCSAERIVVFDRSSRELQRSGFQLRRDGAGYRCHGIDNDYDANPTTSGSIGSCFARLVSTTCTALVGFGVVKDHDLSGVSASLKNWYGVIHNPNKYHDSNCDPYLADVCNHPFLRGKLRLTILDGVIAQCHGGPAFRSDAVFPLGRVAASTDPVAADVWALKVIDAERIRRGLPTLAEAKRPPRFIATAARYGLGVGDPAAVKEVMG
jgi:uncharacterized protein (DUF362 family)